MNQKPLPKMIDVAMDGKRFDRKFETWLMPRAILHDLQPPVIILSQEMQEQIKSILEERNRK